MQDLSHLAADSPWITSQEGGNIVHDNSGAGAGPGTVPVTPMPAVENQADPHVTAIDKPRSVLTAGSAYVPSPAVWKETADG